VNKTPDVQNADDSSVCMSVDMEESSTDGEGSGETKPDSDPALYNYDLLYIKNCARRL